MYCKKQQQNRLHLKKKDRSDNRKCVGGHNCVINTGNGVAGPKVWARHAVPCQWWIFLLLNHLMPRSFIDCGSSLTGYSVRPADFTLTFACQLGWHLDEPHWSDPNLLCRQGNETLSKEYKIDIRKRNSALGENQIYKNEHGRLSVVSEFCVTQ